MNQMECTIISCILLIAISLFSTVLVFIVFFILFIPFVYVVLNIFFILLSCKKRISGCNQKPLYSRVGYIKLFLWVLAILIAFGIQKYKDFDARNSADNIVLSLEKYKASQGKYPNTLSNIGLTGDKWNRVNYALAGYFIDNGKQVFLYSVRWDIYRFDFEKKEWVVDNSYE